MTYSCFILNIGILLTMSSMQTIKTLVGDSPFEFGVPPSPNKSAPSKDKFVYEASLDKFACEPPPVYDVPHFYWSVETGARVLTNPPYAPLLSQLLDSKESRDQTDTGK